MYTVNHILLASHSGKVSLLILLDLSGAFDNNFMTDYLWRPMSKEPRVLPTTHPSRAHVPNL